MASVMAADQNTRMFVSEVLRLLLTFPDAACGVSELFQELKAMRCDDQGIGSPEVLLQVLGNQQQVFQLEGRGTDTKVQATTSLRLCPTHSYKSGSCIENGCPHLHMCKFFLLSGTCDFDKKCHFGHSVATNHNLELLVSHWLDRLTNITELRTLFCLPHVRRGITFPVVCSYYNGRRGCNNELKCQFLHLCRPFVLGTCKFGSTCLRNHDVDRRQVTQVLTRFGVKVKGRRLTDILDEVKDYEISFREERDDSDTDSQDGATVGARGGSKRPRRPGSVPNRFFGNAASPFTLRKAPREPTPRGRYPSVGRRPRQFSEGDPYSSSRGNNSAASGANVNKMEELCVHHLANKCRFREQCNRQHSSKPYLWRLTAVDSLEDQPEWRSLDELNSELLEQNFCRPDVIQCAVQDVDGSQLAVSFREFTAQNLSSGVQYTLKRLSTPSREDNTFRLPPTVGETQTLATVWLWYWKKQGLWNEFKSESRSDDTPSVSINSDVIERRFQTMKDTPLTVGHYVLDFVKMHMKHRETGQKFKVRRRPQLSLKEETKPVLSRSNSDHSLEESVANLAADDIAADDMAVDVMADDVANDSNMNGDINGDVTRDPPHDRTSDDYNFVALKSGSKAFIKVMTPFIRTLGKRTNIIMIRKLRNKTMADGYRQKRETMARESKKQTVAEMTLYYGCDPSEDVDMLCQTGMLCDDHNTAPPHDGAPFGKGGYFHVNAGRADKNNGNARSRTVLEVSCLVGDWGKGGHSRSKKKASKGFDSCVDDPASPKTFYIFDSAQVLIRYVITYEYPQEE